MFSLIFSKISGFLGNKLRVYLALAMVVVGLLFFIAYKYQANRADKAELALQQYKDAVKEENARIRDENKSKEQAAAQLVSEAQSAYLSLAEKYQFNRDKSKREIEEVRHYYEAYINDINGQLDRRLQWVASGDQRMPKSSTDSKRLTEAGRECHATLTQVVEACRITTSDFNRCRAVIDADTKTFGRDEF